MLLDKSQRSEVANAAEIHIPPDKYLIRVLTALEIRWDLVLTGNGDGNWVSVDLDDESDRRLLSVWERLTDLRFRYIEHLQRSQGVQLALPLKEVADG